MPKEEIGTFGGGSFQNFWWAVAALSFYVGFPQAKQKTSTEGIGLNVSKCLPSLLKTQPQGSL